MGKHNNTESSPENASEKAVATLKRTKLFKEIRQDLIDQLARNCTVGKYFDDLVDDYMDLWITKCLLVSDIQLRGAFVPYDNGGGQRGIRKNDSVELRIKVNAQMLKLLSELGIKPAQAAGDDEAL